MKTILITGASTGIGKASAVLFQKNGWNVAATMRNLSASKNIEEMENVKCYRMDITDSVSVANSIKSAITDFGRIDVLLNNAGIYTTGPLECASDEQIRKQIDTNLVGLFNVTKAMLPHFREMKSGTIINLSSIAGRVTFPFQSIYHCTKWGIEGFSEGLQHELKEMNIRVKMVEPGMVKTELYRHPEYILRDDNIKAYDDAFNRWYKYLLDNYDKGFDPEVTARTIFKAANDKSFKLRYASGSDTKSAFFMRKLLPFGLFTSIIRKMSKI